MRKTSKSKSNSRSKSAKKSGKSQQRKIEAVRIAHPPIPNENSLNLNFSQTAPEGTKTQVVVPPLNFASDRNPRIDQTMRPEISNIQIINQLEEVYKGERDAKTSEKKPPALL